MIINFFKTVVYEHDSSTSISGTLLFSMYFSFIINDDIFGTLHP